jgi:CRISPR/Cas system-associated exonuclease Cas4 (RecB family)
MQLPERIDLVRESMQRAAKGTDDKRRRYLGCSLLGHPCERHIWYDFNGFPAEPWEGRIRMLFNLGHLIEAEVIHWLEAAGYQVDGRQDSFTALDGWLRGHCDGIVRHPSLGHRAHLLEIKSASKSAFDKFAHNGIKAEPKYSAQVQLYMGFAGLERALFVVYCKDNSDIYSERVHFERDTFRDLLAKAERIIAANDPPQPIEDYITCKFCRFALICKGGEPMATEGNCGSCKFHRWHGLRKACHHPDHAYWLDRYDGGCPDYVYMFDKAIPGQPPHWPDPVEAVSEYAEAEQ